jgi:hypothetical protein
LDPEAQGDNGAIVVTAPGLAAIVINDSRAATWTNHNRVTDIGADTACGRPKSLALIDGEIAESGLHHSGPGRAGDEQRATNAPCGKQTALLHHEAPDAPQGHR